MPYGRLTLATSPRLGFQANDSPKSIAGFLWYSKSDLSSKSTEGQAQAIELQTAAAVAHVLAMECTVVVAVAIVADAVEHVAGLHQAVDLEHEVLAAANEEAVVIAGVQGQQVAEGRVAEQLLHHPLSFTVRLLYWELFSSLRTAA